MEPTHRQPPDWTPAYDEDRPPGALPPPPVSSMASDNTAGVAPRVIDALVAANTPTALAYGADPWSARALDVVRDLFGSEVDLFPCWGGTGANVVALATLLDPWQMVLCPASAHIMVDECGAPARFTGATVMPIASPDGKLRPDDIAGHLTWLGSEHHPQPAAISISQVTETGTVYSVAEIAALCEAAHRNGLRVHVDGARLANAVAATGSGPQAMLTDTGVDIVSFGLTKNGAMYGDAVVLLRPELAERARFVRKQAGQLPSKARFVAAQMLALLDGDRWVHQAAHANGMAQRLADRVRNIPGVRLAREPEANSVFVHLPSDRAAAAQDWSFFWDWDATQSLYRWMTSFATTEDDVDRFARGIDQVLNHR